MSRKQQAGVTILEVLLVLAIAATMIVLSIKQYQMMKFNTDVNQINYAVNIIADAASKFYYANCNKGQTLGYDIGDMHVPVDIQTQLVDAGYLRSGLITLNPLLEENEDNWKGYVLQFNRYEEPRYICTEQADPDVSATGPDEDQGCSATGKVQVGTVVGWRMQITANVKPIPGETEEAEAISRANVIYRLSTATCKTSVLTGDILIPCVCEWASEQMSASSSGEEDFDRAETIYDDNDCDDVAANTNYVAFVRVPTFFANTELQSGSWQANAVLKEFLLEYDTMPMTYLTSTDHSGAGDIQYFYCGS